MNITTSLDQVTTQVWHKDFIHIIYTSPSKKLNMLIERLGDEHTKHVSVEISFQATALFSEFVGSFVVEGISPVEVCETYQYFYYEVDKQDIHKIVEALRNFNCGEDL